jgi:anti-sigma factor ChrR (cupin superfamily)
MKAISINTKEIDWQVAEGYPSGSMQKLLHDGLDSAPRSIILKILPGWRMEEHAHVDTELHYVLEGEYQSGDKTYPTGTFRMIPKHTNHGDFTTVRGAVILVVWTK